MGLLNGHANGHQQDKHYSAYLKTKGKHIFLELNSPLNYVTNTKIKYRFEISSVLCGEWVKEKGLESKVDKPEEIKISEQELKNLTSNYLSRYFSKIKARKNMPVDKEAGWEILSENKEGD